MKISMRRFVWPLLLLATAALGLRAQSRGNVQEFTADNITVLLHPTSNQLVSVIVGFEGGLASGETSNPALGDFAIDLITSSGSSSVSKEALRSFVSRTSTSIAGEGDARGVRFTMTSTLSNFNEGWKILASLVTSPLYDETEYRNAVQVRMNQIRRRWSNPDDHAEIIADSLLLLNEPILGRKVREEDIRDATITKMKEFMGRVSERSRMIVVVVGNVTEKDVRRKLALFRALPNGAARASTAPMVAPTMTSAIAAPTEPRLEVADRKSPTTYVYGRFAGPRFATPDYWPLQVGLSHLRNILFEEIRTKRNLSYAPGAWLGSVLGSSYGNISVSSTRPDSSVGIMLQELKQMRTREVDAKALESSKAVFITTYYMRQMTNAGVANSIYSAWRTTGDWHNAFALDAIAKVDPPSVLRAFQRYARNLQFGVAGPASGVTRDRYLFRE